MRPPTALETLCIKAVESGDAQAIEQAAAMAGTTPEALRVVIEGNLSDAERVAGIRGPVLVHLADVRAEPVRWLWPGRIALGKLTLIAGDPGLGKSFLTLDLAARVSTGAGWPDAPHARPADGPGGVVLLSAEDDLADTIRPRLDAAGADVARISALQAVRVLGDGGEPFERPFDLTRDLADLEAAIIKTADCRLAVIDPISAFLGNTDSHVNADVRGVLKPLADLAARHGVAVVAVTHLRKGEGAAIYRAMGSMAFVAAARAAWSVSRCPDDPTGKRRLFLPLKNNLGNDGSGLAYCLRSVGLSANVAWEAGPVTLSADDALSAPRGKPGPDAEAGDAAENWLRAALADGPRLARELVEEAREAEGISKRTLERAKAALEVESFQPAKPGPWWWRLPKAGGTPPTPPTDSTHRELGALGGLAENVGFPDIPTPHTAKMLERGGVPPDRAFDDGCSDWPDGEAA